MAVHHATARKLATQSEWTLLQSSYGRSITALTPARLKQKITRTRKLRNKYRDLARRQRGEARGKRRARSARASQGNANTMVKQRMFADALERFEARLAQLHAKPAKRTKSKAAAKRAHSAGSRGARKRRKLTHQSAKAHQGHVGARGRRNQARRDRS